MNLSELEQEVASVADAWNEFDEGDTIRHAIWADRMAITMLEVHLQLAKELRALNATMEQIRGLIDVHVME